MGGLRILVTAGPFFGHVNTVLPFALAAHRAGHDVRLATGPDFVSHVQGEGLAAWPIGPTAVEAGVPRSPADFFDTGGRRAADLLPLTRAWRPDLVVSEEMEFAGPIAAARNHAPLAVHGLGIDVTGGLRSAYAPDIDELGNRWGVPGLAAAYGSAVYLSICPPSLQPPARVERDVLALRPSLGESAGRQPLPAAFDALPYESTIHLTLGTVFHTRHPGTLEAAITGLRDLPANLVVTVGPDVDPDRFGPQPPHVVLARYLPHARLLPLCTLVVSQGGAGIMLGALAHGLPQLVLPQGADQFHNAAVAQQAGFALVLTGGEITRDAVRDAAGRLLRDPGFRDAARAVGREMAAMPDADAVVMALTKRLGVTGSAALPMPARERSLRSLRSPWP